MCWLGSRQTLLHWGQTMPRTNRRPDYDWRCHLFYTNRSGEQEAVFEVSAPDEDAALRVADRMLRNHKLRSNVHVHYAEAIGGMIQ